MDNPVQSQEITMIKSALLASAICFTFVVPAYAQQTVKCDEASLTQMRKDIDALTDQDKKAKSITSWEAANAAFKANNMDECNARIGDTGKNMDTKATTTQ
jgi:hypothetical protein